MSLAASHCLGAACVRFQSVQLQTSKAFCPASQVMLHIAGQHRVCTAGPMRGFVVFLQRLGLGGFPSALCHALGKCVLAGGTWLLQLF